MDLLLSDMVPNASSIGTLDSSVQLALAAHALRFAVLNSAPRRDTAFLCMVWSGTGLGSFVETVGKFYESVEECKPKSSRNESAELFVLGRGFRGAHRIDQQKGERQINWPPKNHFLFLPRMAVRLCIFFRDLLFLGGIIHIMSVFSPGLFAGKATLVTSSGFFRLREA